MHTFDWHRVGSAVVQPDSPSARPHFPFEPHTFVTHWFAFPQLVVTFGPAHVFVTALHLPDWHVASAFASLQTPVWSPSFGIATPFALSSTHVSAFRSQCFAAGQSPST